MRIGYIGGITTLLGEATYWTLRLRLKRRQIVYQMNKIGVDSLLIVTVISLFIGMALAFQGSYLAQKMGMQMYIASFVALAMTREMGPVITALIIAGRVGASIAAEIGTMTVTEQVDALRTLATDPVRYLVVPRLVASMIMLPLLTVYSDFIGMFGGYMVGVWKLGVSSTLYTKMSFDFLIYKDVISGLLKAFIFAIIIAIVACFEGLRCRGGAEGVGRATTQSVVSSFVLIIFANLLLTTLFFFVF